MTISTISGTYTSGITLSNAIYGDPLTVGASADISGGRFLAPSQWTIDNFGHIEGNGDTGVLLVGAGSLFTNEASGTLASNDALVLSAPYSTAINHGIVNGGQFGIYANLGTVTNDGSINGSTQVGVGLYNGGTLTNLAAGTIHGLNWGVKTNGSGSFTVENAGTISGDNFDAVAFYGTVANRLIVDAGAVFNGNVYAKYATASNTIELTSGATAGTLSGLGSKYIGFQTVTIDVGASWNIGSVGVPTTIQNAGTIGAGTTIGAYFYAGGSVTNDATGHITGSSYGVFIARVAGVVDNAGTIESTGGLGIDLGHGGAITNESGGLITGQRGVVLTGANDTVINAGIIASTNGTGISMYQGTVINSGDVSATNGTGVALLTGGTIVNMAGGTITASSGTGAYGGAATTTIENAGTIGGSLGAVYFGGTAANRLIVDAGAVFNGNVKALGASNTLELTSGATAGTLSGLGTKYTGFQTVTIDSGASWTVAGTMTGIGGTTIQGFNTHDTLNLTNLSFASGDTVNLDSGTDILTILSADGTTVLDTVHLAGNFTGDFFHLADNGNYGSYITEDGTPCYCRGTLILTDKGEVAVEDLKIGDLLVTKSGAARPIRWIGTRSYNGRFAAGNRDILPVLIKADALGDNVPKRDLWVSPLHAMYLDGVLIPAMHLVNGTSIVQVESFDTVEYFHLELDTHDVIVAEGALSESFIDDDSRAMFHNAPEYALLYPTAEHGQVVYCAPIVEDGELLETIRRRIDARVDNERTAWAA